LGERVVRNDEVRGSIPLGSTKPFSSSFAVASAVDIRANIIGDSSAAAAPAARRASRTSAFTMRIQDGLQQLSHLGLSTLIAVTILNLLARSG
jgi:hypothetical protein